MLTEIWDDTSNEEKIRVTVTEELTNGADAGRARAPEKVAQRGEVGGGPEDKAGECRRRRGLGGIGEARPDRLG